MKRTIAPLLAIGACLWLAPLAHGQAFDLNIIAGVSFCQIDGDQSAHFNHIGYQAGVATTFPLGNKGKWRMQVEIGAMQKGSEIDLQALSRSISLHYVHLPLLLTYSLSEKEGDRGGLRLGAGIAPAILFRANVETDGVRDAALADNYRRLDALPVVVEARYMLGRHLGLAARYYNSLLHIDKESGNGIYHLFRSNKGQFSNLLSAGLYLRF